MKSAVWKMKGDNMNVFLLFAFDDDRDGVVRGGMTDYKSAHPSLEEAKAHFKNPGRKVGQIAELTLNGQLKFVAVNYGWGWDDPKEDNFHLQELISQVITRRNRKTWRR
jgi:hypothetical protein